jgi:hypothetical protein
VYRGALQPQPPAHPPEPAPAGRHFGGWREKRRGGAVGTRATPVQCAVPALSMHVTWCNIAIIGTISVGSVTINITNTIGNQSRERQGIMMMIEQIAYRNRREVYAIKRRKRKEAYALALLSIFDLSPMFLVNVSN